jgi:hypothetical protein
MYLKYVKYCGTVLWSRCTYIYIYLASEHLSNAAIFHYIQKLILNCTVFRFISYKIKLVINTFCNHTNTKEMWYFWYWKRLWVLFIWTVWRLIRCAANQFGFNRGQETLHTKWSEERAVICSMCFSHLLVSCMQLHNSWMPRFLFPQQHTHTDLHNGLI